jgi:hypothetical protein
VDTGLLARALPSGTKEQTAGHRRDALCSSTKIQKQAALGITTKPILNIKHLFAFLLLSIAPLHAADISKYNVVWDSPSKDSLDSMPLSGRLGAGANVWVEAGSIWIYPSHNGA